MARSVRFKAILHAKKRAANRPQRIRYPSLPQRRRAAKGASAIAASENAHSIRNGAANGDAPPLAAEAAETPKISTGIASGSTSTAISSPPRLQRHRQRRADRADHRQRRRAGEQADGDQRQRTGVHAEHQAEQRAEDRPAARARRPMGGAFDQHVKFERQAGVDQHVERAVLVRRPGTAGRARAASRAAPRSTGSPGRSAPASARSGPTRERHDRHQDEEEHRADRRAAADRGWRCAIRAGTSAGRRAHAAAPVAGASPRVKLAPRRRGRAARGWRRG